MRKQLTKMVGVAMFAALALAGTLGIFAFSASQPVSAQTSTDVTRSFSADEVKPGGTVDVTITVVKGLVYFVTETLPDGWVYQSVSPKDAIPTKPSGQVISFSVAAGDPVTYTVKAPGKAGTGTFSGMFGLVQPPNIITDGATMVTVATDATDEEDAPESKILSSREPGAVVRIEIDTTATDEVSQGEDISIKLKSFDLPATISESHVIFSDGGGTTTSYTGNPSEARVSGSDTIILTVPVTLPNGNPNPNPVTGLYKIVIKQSAGITNPTAGGDYTVEVDDADDVNDMLKVKIDRVIKLSTIAGTRGTMTTATFKGFSNGTATVNLNGEKLDEVTIADNVGTLEIDTTSSDFEANREGGNEITATDGSGNPQNVPGKFTISAKVVLDPEETSVSKNVTIKLSDWPLTHAITKVTIGATPTDIDQDTKMDGVQMPQTGTDGKAEFSVQVPSDVNRGSQTVKVTGTDPDPTDSDVSAPSATASLKVGVLTLTAQPAMAVPGQQITIQGSGFVANDSFGSVNVGGIAVPIAPAVKASSAGDIVITINVPSPPAIRTTAAMPIGNGPKTISVAATGSNRVAEGEIEIPKAAITISPETSRRGTSVSVSGTGFPSGDLVQVKYENNEAFVTVAAGAADASGAVSIDFVVPSYAKIGTKHNIEATSVGVYAGVTAEGTHETPGAMVTLSSQQIASGQNITISGVNFPAFSTVAVMEIGGVDVRPVPAPATSIDGDFESTVLVPQLELGNQTVSIRVSQTTITTFLELSTVTVSRAPADVFASLGDRLVRVWYLERSTQVWSFYDPDPDVAAFNTLTEVSSGQNVSIIISSGANIGFQDKTLYPGTNPIALD